MSATPRLRFVLAFLAMAVAFNSLPLYAGNVPAELPDPDGKPGDASKPVKVYILAGQSNMVGFGTLSGAKCPYAAIYLTADPDAALGPFTVYRGGNYKIASLGIYVSADKNAERGATVSYKSSRGQKTEKIAFGSSAERLALRDGETCVVKAFIEVPESGNYLCGPGYRDSAYNVMTLDGKEVYRKNVGEAAVREKVTLEAGKRYPIEITYFMGGSTAFWMSQVDLLGKGDLQIATERNKQFPWMVDAEGKWTVRNDVYYQEVRIAADGKGGPLTATSNGKFIGPEVPFGFVMGAFHDEQVLLIESSMGNRALSYDFRPPSSGRTDPDSKWEGLEYRLMVEGVHKTLNTIEKVVPGYKGQGYEIAGFVWWQGHKDSGKSKEEYEKHLCNIINDLRKEFKAPEMRAVVATVGFGGYGISDAYMEILKAQMAVGDLKQHPEYAGKVASVDTRGYWRDNGESPTGTGYHYNHNAETYMLVGDALGRAMVELQGGKAEPLPYGHRPEPAVNPAAAAPVEMDEAAKAAAAEASKKALEPIVVDGMMASYIEHPNNKAALVAAAHGEKPARASQFLRDSLYSLKNYYHAVGVTEYDWHVFGPDLTKVKWDYLCVDPKVTKPEANWFAPDFDGKKAGWKQGHQPFGSIGGRLEFPGNCAPGICGCGVPPKSLWDKDTLMMRTTIDVPPLKEGHRYRIVVGGSAHVNAGSGYKLYINGKMLAQSGTGVPNRQGGQPRGGHIYDDFRKEFEGGKVIIAATSSLRYTHPRIKDYEPRGHITITLEEMKLPPVTE